MSVLSLLRLSAVRRLLSATLLGRVPAAMAAVALSIVLRHRGLDYAFIGVTAGVFALAAAAGGPVLGRLVDRLGQPLVLMGSAIVSALGFVLLAVAGTQHVSVLVGAGVAGVATPPLEPCLRVLWPSLVPAERIGQAYALDAASQEAVFVTAPLVVAGFAAAGSPDAALWCAAVLTPAATAVVAGSRAARDWRAEARHAHWLGPLRSRGLLVLFTALFGVGVALGALTILAVGYAEARPVPGGAGLVMAVNAVGALTGGIAYGALDHGAARLPGTPTTRLVVLATWLAAGYVLVCLVPPVPVLLLLMIVTGLGLAPVLTLVFTLVGDLAPAGTVTEAFAWLVTLMTVGSAVGSAVAGPALERHGPAGAAIVGAVGAVAGAVVFAAGRRTLRA